jgi:pimeloyl-ACP methyl ester carboxylesterase
MPSIQNTSSHNIYYEIHGDICADAEHTILFTHGNGNCVEDWHALGYTKKLKGDYKLIMIDALGYGESDKPHDVIYYAAENRASDILAVLDHLDLNKVHFFGASIGGSVGFVLADLYPERFLSYMIGMAHPYGAEEPIGENLFNADFRQLMADEGIVGFVEELEEKYIGSSFDARIRDRYLENDAQALIAANTLPWKNRADVLHKIKVSVFLYAGDKDPVSQFQEEMAGIIKDADYHIFTDTDHANSYWNSEKIVLLIKKFLNERF